MTVLEPFTRLEPFTIATPASTLAAAPLSTAITFEMGEVVGLGLVIPPGHSGLTGIRLLNAQQQVFPWKVGSWLIGDEDDLEYPVTGWPTNGKWTAVTYNTDVNDHSHYLRFLVRELPGAGEATAAALAPSLVGLSGQVGLAV